MSLVFNIFLSFFLSAGWEPEVRVHLLEGTETILIKGEVTQIGLQKIPSNTPVKIIQDRGFWFIQLESQRTQVFIPRTGIKISGNRMQINRLRLPPNLRIQPKKNLVQVIGLVPLEEYLMGVIRSEMPVSWPIEALKAQAVAARSYSLAVLKQKQDNPYHLHSSVLDQVYRAYPKFNSKSMRKIKKIVDETRGLVLRNNDSKAVEKAFYHSDCGGVTVGARGVWGKEKIEKVAIDDGCPATPNAKWKLELTRQEFIQSFKNLLPNSPLPSFKLELDSPGPRVKMVKLAGNGLDIQIPAHTFRRMLGYSKLKSTRFSVEEDGSRLVFRGKGYGHGVGLCQWGSRNLARQKFDFIAILNHYYPHTYISRSDTDLKVH